MDTQSLLSNFLLATYVMHVCVGWCESQARQDGELRFLDPTQHFETTTFHQVFLII